MFWNAFCSLPQEQQDWEASHKLSQGITHYRQILPLLNKLHNKVQYIMHRGRERGGGENEKEEVHVCVQCKYSTCICK